MARTIHKEVLFARCHRRFRNMNFRKAEASAVDAFKEMGLIPSNRLNSWFSRIPNSWDDYPVSANDEYHAKKFWDDWRSRINQSHFSNSQRNCN